MGDIIKQEEEKCYSCGKQCINVEFCNEGASYDTEEDGGVSLSRNLRVKIIANPDFWGFSGVLVEGWARFNNGFYDFFDGYDEDHKATKTCNSITTGPFLNEARPDVFYRSVYDPETSTVTHYGSTGSTETKNRGGAEVYLIDRPDSLVASVSSDSASCDTTEPTQVFKKFPENFGWGNKIHFKNKVYKNITGAWRFVDFDNCGSTLTQPSGRLAECDGTSKQNVSYRDNKFAEYDQFRFTSDGEGCLPDGATAGEYAGLLTNSGLYRETGVSPFLQAHLASASGLRNGMTLAIDVDSFKNNYTIFDVSHGSEYTSVKFVGTNSDTTVDPIGSGDSWIALGTYDEQTCCGGAAYGVDPEGKALRTDNYHTDFRRVFNNPKNLRQANRDSEWRYDYGLGTVSVNNAPNVDYLYPSVTDSGTILLSEGDSGVPVFERENAYYGPFHEVDLKDSGLRLVEQSEPRMRARNATCYTKHATVEVFPDCVTQWKQYKECDTEIDKYQQNRVPRLSIVYRGCEFDQTCNFDASGRPLGLWENQGGVPTGIDDLKQGLAGQEIHMFVNLGIAWGGTYQTCPCSCDESPPPGSLPPDHVLIPSPVTFASLPNFDLDPEAYGCNDVRYQLTQYRRWVLGDGGSPGPIAGTGQCDPIPGLEEACHVRQPYVTYGHMMNLCGKQSQDRKNVIASAFAKLAQDRSYTNETPEVDVEEPMYWAFENPTPFPFSTGVPAVWSTGVTGDDRLVNVAGEKYGYWGLADDNNTLIAPYYRTKEGYTDCCTLGTSPEYVDFDASGTFFNGWPSGDVPFFVELEVDDLCMGCATVNMEPTTLKLELESLDTEYIHGFGSDDGDAYGFNHCRYGNRIATVEPPYTCASGFPEDFCEVGGDGFIDDYGHRYDGATCSCVNGTEITLNPVYVSGSDFVIGYISGSTSDPTVEITGCSDRQSGFLDTDYFPTSAAGYAVFAKFTLACEGFEYALTDPFFPNAAYEGDPINSLWGLATDCAQHHPARFGPGGDLRLVSTFYIVAEPYRDLFKSLSLNALEKVDLTQGLAELSFTGVDNIFGLCPGDKVYTWGCFVDGDLYGCHGGGYGSTPCPSSTLCNTCPTGTGSGEISCSCDTQIGYEGIEPRRPPANYQLNDCFCDCKDPYLIAEYELDSNLGLVLVSGSGVGCADVYWMSASGADVSVPPTLLYLGPPNPFLGIDGGQYITEDWFTFSHSVNAKASGIKYRINPPDQDNTCGGLTPRDCDPSTCENDSNVDSGTCGNPIYHSGVVTGVTVNKKKCYPEIAIVNKIECVPSGNGSEDAYRLIVSREYHEHDRTWLEQIVNDLGDPVCVPRQAGAYRYTGLPTSGCETLNFAIPADGVTPAYEAPCSIHPSSGTNVSQDFQYTNDTFSPSGDRLWNYFNLFYEDGFPTSSVSGISPDGTYVASVQRDSNGAFDCNVDGTIQISGTIFSNSDFTNPTGLFGTEATNRRHSCLRDQTECGGELWCNKLFFPRHHYASGTRVSHFGAPSLCLANADFKTAYGMEGYEDISDNDILKEQRFRYVNWCDLDQQAVIIDYVDRDDIEILVDDYLPLIGVTHPGWRYTLDQKSCTVVGTGCVGDLMSTHSDYTIRIGAHLPKTFSTDNFDSMGYYLDKVNASGVDNCLLNPFKIMLDVECSTNTIRRKNVEADFPTQLTGYSRFPAEACKGLVGDPPCTCGESPCQFNGLERKATCQPFRLLELVGGSGTAQVIDDCDNQGNFNIISNVVTTGVYVHEDTLSPLVGISGVQFPFQTTIDCDGETLDYATASGLNDWVAWDCGEFARTGVQVWVHYWECDEYQYITPSQADAYSDVCSCETDFVRGLCTAVHRCTDYTSCDCNPVFTTEAPPSGGVDTPSGWWATDCGCEATTQEELPCTDSIVKVTITEDV